MLSAVKDYLFGRARSPLEEDPKTQELFIAYTEFVYRSRNGLFALLTSDARRAHLLKVDVPLAFDEFCMRVEYMDPAVRASFEESMLAGYEAGKEKVRPMVESIVATIKEKYGT